MFGKATRNRVEVETRHIQRGKFTVMSNNWTCNLSLAISKLQLVERCLGRTQLSNLNRIELTKSIDGFIPNRSFAMTLIERLAIHVHGDSRPIG